MTTKFSEDLVRLRDGFPEIYYLVVRYCDCFTHRIRQRNHLTQPPGGLTGAFPDKVSNVLLPLSVRPQPTTLPV